MTFKLFCFEYNWIRTTFIVVASAIFILMAYMSHYLLFGGKHIIITFNSGTFSPLPQNSFRYNMIPNSNIAYQGHIWHSVSSFNGIQSQSLNPRNLYDYSTKTIREDVLKQLSKDLRLIMAERLPPEAIKVPETCTEETRGNSCEKGDCLQLQLPNDPQKRLEQLVRPEYLHPNEKYLKVIQDMGNAIPGFYDVILITGASSNHYIESKKHLHNIHNNVVPYLRNFTIIYYNLGLTVEQKKDISSMCQCHVLDFPFDKFPSNVSLLKCYTWKPIVINAHAPHCNVIHWMDVSIRYYKNPSNLRELLRRVRVRGFQSSAGPKVKMSHRTLREMFHFFGDEACVYFPYTEDESGFIMLHNEPLIKWGILEPWTACALNDSCMCLKHPNVGLYGCKERKGQYDYGLCHRYDQSALGIIVRKLFREKSDHLLFKNRRKFFMLEKEELISLKKKEK